MCCVLYNKEIWAWALLEPTTNTLNPFFFSLTKRLSCQGSFIKRNESLFKKWPVAMTSCMSVDWFGTNPRNRRMPSTLFDQPCTLEYVAWFQLDLYFQVSNLCHLHVLIYTYIGLHNWRASNNQLAVKINHLATYYGLCKQMIGVRFASLLTYCTFQMKRAFIVYCECRHYNLTFCLHINWLV